jgi:hypothetical protein
MSICTPRVLAYCHHKSKGLAYVKQGRDFVYLGIHDSPESNVKYARSGVVRAGPAYKIS